MLFNFDGRFHKSLRALLRPGLLAHHYVRGVRRDYMGPVALFFLVAVLYFFALPLTYRATVLPYYRLHRPGPINEWLAELAASDPGRTALVDFAGNLDRFSQDLARSTVLVMVPVFAVLLALVFAGRRRLLAEHVVFALEFFSFFWLLTTIVVFGPLIVLTLILEAFGVDSPQWVQGTPVEVFVFVVCLLYLTVASRRFYGSRGRWRDLAYGAATTACLWLVLTAYRVGVALIALDCV